MAHIVLLLLLLHVVIAFPCHAKVAVLAMLALLIELSGGGDFKLELALDVCIISLLWSAVHVVTLSDFTVYL